jgi:type IV pilus assembly protein PilM
MAKNGVQVGIDLEQSSIAGAQVKSGRQACTLTNVAVRALPEGLMYDGEVIDVEGLAAELRSFWKQSGFSGKKFALGVANQKIVVRTMEFPLIDPKELRAAIEFQAQEAIPIPLDDAVLDYQVLSTVNEGEGGGRQKVLIVAAQHDMIAQFTAAAHKAGLSIDGIDLHAFALVRAMAPPVPFVDEGAASDGAGTALVNIGAGITDLIVVAGGLPQFTRVINVGCEASVQALMAHRGINHDEADALRLNIGVSGSAPPVGDLEPGTIGEIHDVLDAASEAFADEIRRSIDYHHSMEPSSQISGLLLSGEGSLTRNMCEYLSAALHMPVQLGDPLQHIPENKSKLSQSELEAMSPRLAVALGLAMDDEG